MRLILKGCIAGISVLPSVVAPLMADIIDPDNADIRYVGRLDWSDPAAPRMYWSGTHLMAWFEGTSCKVKLNSTGKDYFNIIINDGDPVVVGLEPGSQWVTVEEGLPDGIHKLELFKRTSYQQGNTAFEGLRTDDGKGLVAPPPAPKVRIQFYGDSITDGNSVDAPADNQAPHYWNNYLTYAAITARNLNMEYVCCAASGIAVIHPWSDGFIMDNYYDRLIPGDNSPSGAWDYSNDKTDIVVINLFQNDAWVKSSPHSPAEQERIISAYENLVLKIRSVHPGAEIICALGNMDATREGSVWPGYIKAAVERVSTTHGDSKIHTLFFPFKMSDGHPIAAEQAPMAEQLTAFIQDRFRYLLEPAACQD